MKKNLNLLFCLLISQFAHSQALFLNEVMSNNIRVVDDQGENEDWIEIFNASTETIELSSYFLTDDFSQPDKWQFPAGSQISPNSFILIWADDDVSENDEFHCNFKISKEGESIFLMKENGSSFTLIDQIDVPVLPENSTYGRVTDGATDFIIFGEYSPGFSNNSSLPFNDDEVVFSLNPGFYTSGTTLTLSSSNPTAEIYYTTNGKRPDRNDNLYSGEPIILDSTVFIRATACVPNFAPAVPVDCFYLIDGNHEVPVVHIATDSINLWGDYEGIYTTGENGVQLYCSNDKRNWNQPWKRRSNITFFEENGEIGFSKLAEVKISGNCSRAFKMKSLNITLEDEETTEYPLFQHLPFTNYRQFKLRNSGNDSESTMLRDGAIQNMLEGQIDIDLMAYRPVILYVNGSYFGIYGLREVMNGKYLKQHYEVEEPDLFSNLWGWAPEIISGNRDEWDAINDWMNGADLSKEEDYEYLKTKVDVSQFMDYYLTQTYIANADWPNNNMRMWRDRENPNSKWRWMLFDLDLSSNFDEFWRCSDVVCNTLEHASEPGLLHTRWIRRMFENPHFVNEFVQRYCTVAQSIFSPERAHHQIDSLTDLLRPEIPTHIDHWLSQPEEMGELEWTPAGGAIEGWEERITKFKNFFSERFRWTLEQYSAKFDIWEYFELQINVEDSEQGKVVLHENKMVLAPDYSGTYFANIAMRVEAVPATGYRFVKWKETENFDAVFYLKSNENQRLTPIFVKEENYIDPLDENASIYMHVFPNPTSDAVNFLLAYGRTSTGYLSITDALGQSVHQEELVLERHPKRHILNLTNWQSGVYFVRIVVEEEERVERVVVQ